MIVKVQIPLVGNEVLVYNEDQSYLRQFPMLDFSGPVVEEMRLARKLKAYYEVTRHGGALTFGNMVKDQAW